MQQRSNQRNRLTEINAKKLFIVDGFGALVSAILLGIVLVRYQPFIGMPISALYFLAVIPVLFLVYDVICYLRGGKRVLLKPIAIANFVYCVISATCVLIFYRQLTGLGLGYFIGEIVLVALIASLELKESLRSKA